MAAPTLFWTMFHKSMLKIVQGWRFLKTKNMLGSTVKYPCSKFRLVCIHEHTIVQIFYFYFFFFRGVYCTGLAKPSVMFCCGFVISINPLDILTLLMYDNFPIQKINKLRTSQPQKNDEHLMPVRKYLPVKTRIIEKPKPVGWFGFQISW